MVGLHLLFPTPHDWFKMISRQFECRNAQLPDERKMKIIVATLPTKVALLSIVQQVRCPFYDGISVVTDSVGMGLNFRVRQHVALAEMMLYRILAHSARVQC